MRLFLLTFLALALGIIRPASADIVYSVQIDTSSINGSNGNLDFQFPGDEFSQPGTVSIYDFASDGVLGIGEYSGDVNGGDLPNPVNINNTPFSYNNFYTPFTFGSSLAFKLSFSGLAATHPVPLAGSTFTFSMLDNGQNDPDGNLKPVLVTDNDGGFALSVVVGENPTNFMTTGSVIVGAVPEPEEYAMMLVGAAMVAFQVKRKQKRSLTS